MMWIYILAVLAILQGIASLRDGIRSAKHIRTYRPRSSTHPRVVVFCPCRGIDPEFRKNIASIRDQDYPAFEVFFIVDSDDDPACRELRELGAAVLVAGYAVDCGQKVHNLRYAVDHAPKSAEIFVFCDSDARYPRHWIRSLVAPLDEAEVAVSTGYRWYSLTTFHLSTLLRSVWNASVVTMLGNHDRNFAWGGSTALRREVFDQIQVRNFWVGSISDDYGITRAARTAGRRIVFVPACLIPSYGDCGWKELLEFTTRQILITRIYDPRIWRTALIAQFFYCFVFWNLFIVMWNDFPAAVMWVVLFGLSAGKAAIRLRAVRIVLPDGALSKYRWSYILLAPFIAVLFAYNLLRSALTRQLVWRQIHYNLLSPNRVVVRRGAGES